MGGLLVKVGNFPCTFADIGSSHFQATNHDLALKFAMIERTMVSYSTLLASLGYAASLNCTTYNFIPELRVDV